jgi:hypothetical protein
VCLFSFSLRKTAKMSAYRINRSIISFVIRPSTTRNSGTPLERPQTNQRSFSAKQCRSAEIREPERSAPSHVTTTVSPDAHVYAQRREISTSHLDNKQDGRERVVILGSGML